MPPHLPPAEYYASLPKALAGAGAVFHDPHGRVLLVQPSYRNDSWEIPGGAMEPGEHPWQTAHREIKEELGYDLRPGRLLVVDWVPQQPDGRPALANFVFDGGTLTEQDARDTLHLQPDELTAWRLCSPDEADGLLAPHLARRIRACVSAVSNGHTAYLHHGNPVDAASTSPI